MVQATSCEASVRQHPRRITGILWNWNNLRGLNKGTACEGVIGVRSHTERTVSGTCEGIPGPEGTSGRTRSWNGSREPWKEGCFGGEMGAFGQGTQPSQVTAISYLGPPARALAEDTGSGQSGQRS